MPATVSKQWSSLTKTIWYEPAVGRYQSSLSASMGETLTASLAGSTLATTAASKATGSISAKADHGTVKVTDPKGTKT